MKDELRQARERLTAARNLFVVAHERPDGDAIGSLLALTLALRSLGKQATPVLADGVPARFRFLPGAADVQSEFSSACDCLVTVDCSDLQRLGFPEGRLPRLVDINFDHHPTNTLFGEVNIVAADAAATAEVLLDAAPELGLPMTPEIATNLLMGLVTDTIGFRTSNVTPKVLRDAARLMELGAPLREVYERGLNRHSFVSIQYWAAGLTRLEREAGLVWAELTLEDRRRVGYPGPDDADLINLLSSIEGAQVTIIFVEQAEGRTKVSWRARDGVNVARVAGRFGGGGHEQASGAMVAGSLDEVKREVLSATREAMQADARTGP
jgi:phosphoesterase RecJ-like protein